MRFSAPTTELAELAGWVARAIGSFSSSPILGGIRVKADGTQVTLTAFNYDSLHTGSLVGIIEEPGEVLIPGDRFANLLSRLRGPVVDVSLAEGWLELACKATRAKFHLMDLAQYPATGDQTAVGGRQSVLQAADFQAALASLTPVASREPGAKPWETGVRLLGVKDRGVGLYCGNRPRGIIGRTFVAAHSDDFEILAPAKQISDAARQLEGEVQLGNVGGNVHLTTADRQATLRTLEGEFPASVEGLFAPSPELSLKIDREALIGSLKLIESGGDQVMIALSPDGLELASANSSPDNLEGAVSDVVECQVSINDECTALWANLKNLQLALSGLTSEMIELDFLPKRQLGVRDSATHFVMSTLRPPEERKINV
jgi:DNA polymerase-3 subunit beta